MPSDDTIQYVKEWLFDHGIEEHQLGYSPGRDWITVGLPVSVIERILQTEYFLYKDGDAIAIRAPEWSLPQHLHDHIEAIQPTSSFFQVSAKLPRSLTPVRENYDNPLKITNLNRLTDDFSDGPGNHIDLNNPPSDLTPSQACNTSAVTPLCLRTLYGTLSYVPQVPERNQMALTNYLGEFNNRSDVRLFLEAYRPDAADAANNFVAKEIGGAINQQSPADSAQLERGVGREGNLDAEVMIGIGYPTPLVTYTTGGPAPPFQVEAFAPTISHERYLTWLQYVLAQPSLPSVISTSYADLEPTIPYAYAKRVCETFAQLGARGVTVIFGSGDSGVGRPEECHSNDGNDTPEFVPHFPDCCPYVTSVGATRNIEPEVVAYNDNNGFVSGGGFSKYFSRPAYQDKAVGAYVVSLGNKYEGMFNKNGRGYPDIAAQGYRYVTFWNGTKKLVDGTSASAPTMAAIISLVNDALIADGKPVLGFLNPWLYSEGFKSFTDITIGSIKGCNTSGFPAAVGWDAASGFGTPVSLCATEPSQNIY